jgi:hypothetical protein
VSPEELLLVLDAMASPEDEVVLVVLPELAVLPELPICPELVVAPPSGAWSGGSASFNPRMPAQAVSAPIKSKATKDACLLAIFMCIRVSHQGIASSFLIQTSSGQAAFSGLVCRCNLFEFAIEQLDWAFRTEGGILSE